MVEVGHLIQIFKKSANVDNKDVIIYSNVEHFLHADEAVTLYNL